jgi:xanthine dehydrogenase molybdopterin-binding subunit B
MLGLSVFHAIRDAIATEEQPLPDLQAPATPEAVLNAIEKAAS